MVQHNKLAKAVHGWDQCVSILRDTTASLDFALAAIKDAHRETMAFRPNPVKAERMVKAEAILRTAKAYCDAQSAA